MEEQSGDPEAAGPCRTGAVSHRISQGMLVPAWGLEECPAPP